MDASSPRHQRQLHEEEMKKHETEKRTIQDFGSSDQESAIRWKIQMVTWLHPGNGMPKSGALKIRNIPSLGNADSIPEIQHLSDPR